MKHLKMTSMALAAIGVLFSASAARADEQLTTVPFAFLVAVLIAASTLGLSAQAQRAGQPGAAGGRGAAPAPAPTPPCGPNLTIKNVAKDSRCFELRTYTVREGSSIDLLHSRFRDH